MFASLWGHQIYKRQRQNLSIDRRLMQLVYRVLGFLGQLRAYPEGFALRLLELYEGRDSLPYHLRHRATVDPTLTDRQLFSRMELGDPWLDAQLYQVFRYLYDCDSVEIPASWSTTMKRFNDELTQLAPNLHPTCCESWPVGP